MTKEDFLRKLKLTYVQAMKEGLDAGRSHFDTNRNFFCNHPEFDPNDLVMLFKGTCSIADKYSALLDKYGNKVDECQEQRDKRYQAEEQCDRLAKENLDLKTELEQAKALPLPVLPTQKRLYSKKNLAAPHAATLSNDSIGQLIDKLNAILADVSVPDSDRFNDVLSHPDLYSSLCLVHEMVPYTTLSNNIFKQVYDTLKDYGFKGGDMISLIANIERFDPVHNKNHKSYQIYISGWHIGRNKVSRWAAFAIRCGHIQKQLTRKKT